MRDTCPHCKVSWQGDPIPADIVHHYAGTHYDREIGIDGGLLGLYDGTVAWLCPDCKKTSPRSEEPWGRELYEKYLDAVEKES